MTTRTWTALLLALTLAIGCKSLTNDGHGQEAHGDGPASQSLTHFTGQTELFVEFPALVVGATSRFAVHLTKLDDFKPVSAGHVTVVLSGGGAPDERFEVATPKVPGIYGLDVVPRHAGERELSITLAAAEAEDRHQLGSVKVHANAREAARASADEHPSGGGPGITYLKEQQWRTEFATAPVSERPLRAAVIANGDLRARPEGEARLSAPVAGRLVTAGTDFPRIGMEVRRDQVLATIAPRLGGDTDLATLDLAVSRARIDLEHARHERERLEGLFQQNAVPERRVVEARHHEATTEAELSAAQSRLSQYHGTQRAGASGAAGRVAVRSPIQGTVVQVQAAPGAFLEEGREMFHVVDLDRLWLEIQIPEVDIARVRRAAGAWFEVEGFERPFEVTHETGGRVIAFGGVVDPQTRTAPLIFEFPNPNRDLRVGMFARVRVLSGESVTATAVPTSAIVDEGGQDIAYVQMEGEAFDRRVLRLGVRDGDLVQVTDGLRPGERVVTRGAYYIRLSAASGSIPAHGHVH